MTASDWPQLQQERRKWTHLGKTMKRSLFLLAAIATVVALAPKPGYAHRYFDTWAVEDPALRGTRWTTPDPMLDLYPGWSPYSYGLDNPLRNVDPSGDTTYAYNQNQDLVPIDNSPDVITWGRQDPNYVSGNFTWFADFNWVIVDPIYGRFHNMRTQIIPTANGARWYETKPTVNMGIFDLPIGPGGDEQVVEKSLQYAMQESKLAHLLQDKHLIQPLVDELGGSENFLKTVIQALQESNLSQGTFDVTKDINGTALTIRGFVDTDRTIKLGTIFSANK